MKPVQNQTKTTTDAVVALSLIDAHERNYNQHPPEQVARLAKSIKMFGQVRGVVVQWQPSARYLCLAGHGVVEGLRVEGKELARVALVPDGWSPAKCLAYLAADNELGRGAVADAVALEALVQEVALSDRDLAELAAGSDAALMAAMDGGSGNDDGESPDEFKEVDEDIDTDFKCPKCSYAWSGKPK